MDNSIHDERIIHIVNKVDLLAKDQLEQLKSRYQHIPVFWISCLKDIDTIDVNCTVNCTNPNRDGFSACIQAISDKVELLSGDPEAYFINERQTVHLKKIIRSLSLTLDNIEHDLPIASHHLQSCVHQISQLTGKVTTDEILDTIFSRFCIGK